MAYNVLYYGDRPPCQGPHSQYHNYLKTIVAYSNPDVLSLEKMAAIPMYTGDNSGTAPAGFADSILTFALNAAFPGRYSFCPYSNSSGADNINVLFYNKQKLGFLTTVCSYSNVTDFNTYKLYYRDSTLATTHDTVFLYVTLNHTQSGTATSDTATRNSQINGEMNQLQTHFTHLPNILNMGDFNLHNSSETCYQRLINPSDTNFRFFDPPFYPDALYSYPADWDNNPSSFAHCLTTSTRQSSSVPNSCGTSGGGKSWYDHIFVSSSIIHNGSGLYYIPHSYRTIGNDGNRVGISINSTTPANTSAPAGVIDALFQMSNKYPVMVNLLVSSPPAHTQIIDQSENESKVTISNPFVDKFTLNFPNHFIGQQLTLECFDVVGSSKFKKIFTVTDNLTHIPNNLSIGSYFLKLTNNKDYLFQTILIRQ